MTFSKESMIPFWRSHQQSLVDSKMKAFHFARHILYNKNLYDHARVYIPSLNAHAYYDGIIQRSACVDGIIYFNKITITLSPHITGYTYNQLYLHVIKFTNLDVLFNIRNSNIVYGVSDAI